MLTIEGTIILPYLLLIVIDFKSILPLEIEINSNINLSTTHLNDHYRNAFKNIFFGLESFILEIVIVLKTEVTTFFVSPL